MKSDGARATTMQDVADRAGVSKALVSMIFRGVQGPSAATRDRVMEVADALDYRPNRSAALLSLRRTHLIGVMTSIRNTFHTEMVEHIVEQADRHGYEVVLGPVTPTRDEESVMRTLLDFRCEAIILLGPEIDADTMKEWNKRVPLVVVGRRMPGSELDVVRAGDLRGMGAVVDHLVELGHERILHLTGGSNPIAADRRTGYIRAMHRHGLDAYVQVIDGDFTEKSGVRAAEEIVGMRTRPTAVVASNDRSAVGLLDSLQRAGISVPGDMSVTGYDDSVLAHLAHVDLTSVSQEPRDQATRAVDAAVERLDKGRTEALSVVLRPRLIARSTSGPAPA
ncbi:LacI family transcriptional regulator [Rhodococcoides trifolii]|uniref:LacI family transcriptional regulator n=1 Tax=Rhodococcoides trifolii TaxID=908250 RepID=A0A917G7A9_9NOCA|nr:LacI family DNA-binding transcriptional regulator [Rhodococcus trifolii]GGG25796.1 LacI family transcriptional regulator [Rhodococcus trifolii]